MISKRSRRLLLASTLLLLPLAGSAADQSAAKPTIAITTIPPWDAGGPDKMARIAGTVGDAACDCRIVLFARGDVWYVQPWVAAPYTAVGRNGRWENDTHLGREYAALLVKVAYKPPSMTGMLPALSDDILAIARVEGRR